MHPLANNGAHVLIFFYRTNHIGEFNSGPLVTMLN